MPRMLRKLVLSAIVTGLWLGPALAQHVTAAAAPAWPQLLGNAGHTSLVAATKLTVAAAPQLGINWMAPMRSADLGSPVAAYSAAFGKTIAVVGDESGYVTAFNQAGGATLWSTSVGFGDAERASPAIAPDGNVWVATAYGSALYKLNGTTGAIMCSIPAATAIDASPMIATTPDGTVTVFIGMTDTATLSGPTIAVDATTCKQRWSFTQYLQIAGPWATPAYGVDKNGRALIFEGTADLDSAEYAIDAQTGAPVWNFKMPGPSGNYDIAAGATVSPPGNNGFSDGVLYVTSKFGIMYALDLTSGSVIWSFNYNAVQGVTGGGRSSAALTGNTIVFGMVNGVYALNATTGVALWHYKDPADVEVISSPAIAGPAGNQIVTFGDTAGALHVLALATGASLYSYQTGNYITSSPAIVNNSILIDSADGFLYDFAIGGGNTAPGTTVISSPAQGSQIANPNGSLTVQGSAADGAGVRSVRVSIQAGGPTGSWYNAATGGWVSGPVDNVAPVANPGSPHSNWSLPFPVPAAGGTYQIFANAVDRLGQVDRIGAQPTFSVLPSRSQPTVTPSALFVGPGDSLTVSANAFAPGEAVSYSVQGKVVGQATADGSGFVPAIGITINAAATFGLTSIVATGKTSGLTTTGELDITNIWSQFGFGATRTGYEPNDKVFAQTLDATKSGYVARAWTFATGAPVNSSPAVTAGDVFVGNDAGAFYAIDTISGAAFWRYVTPTGQPIHSAPAVDVNAGLVMFGCDDGTLYSLDAATGTLSGSIALDGIPGSPAVAGGSIYVGTDGGTIWSIGEATGAVTWSRKLAAAVHAPPAIDSAAGIVITGDDSGTITALTAANGAILWSVQTGNAVVAPPGISGGIVYVGSTDGSLYAINEKTGAVAYTYGAGSPISAGVSLPPDNVIFGAANGSLYDLAQKTGALAWQIPYIKAPIVGVGSVVNVPWIETADGAIRAAKSNQAHVVFTFATGAGLSTAPTIVDGAVYVGAQDGGVYAFTPFGFAPFLKTEQLRERAALRRNVAHWRPTLSQRGAALATRSFQPFGLREFPLHIDRTGAPPSAPHRSVYGGRTQAAPRRYVIAWLPAGAAAAGLPVSPAFGAGGIQAVTDRRPYPGRLDDAFIQAEITRVARAHAWALDINAQVIVLTTDWPIATGSGFCSYRSAFDLDGRLTQPVPYAVVPLAGKRGGCGALPYILQRLAVELASDPLLAGAVRPVRQ